MSAIDLENDRLLKISEVSHRTGFAPSTIYKKMEDAGFPKPIHLGTRTVRWWQSEVARWILDTAAKQQPEPGKKPGKTAA